MIRIWFGQAGTREIMLNQIRIRYDAFSIHIWFVSESNTFQLQSDTIQGGGTGIWTSLGVPRGPCRVPWSPAESAASQESAGQGPMDIAYVSVVPFRFVSLSFPCPFSFSFPFPISFPLPFRSIFCFPFISVSLPIFVSVSFSFPFSFHVPFPFPFHFHSRVRFSSHVFPFPFYISFPCHFFVFPCSLSFPFLFVSVSLFVFVPLFVSVSFPFRFPFRFVFLSVLVSLFVFVSLFVSFPFRFRFPSPSPIGTLMIRIWQCRPPPLRSYLIRIWFVPDSPMRRRYDYHDIRYDLRTARNLYIIKVSLHLMIFPRGYLAFWTSGDLGIIRIAAYTEVQYLI